MTSLNENQSYILTVSPNPAWQKTLFFQEFISGNVNRAEKVECYASGKGVNFCRAARRKSIPTILFQFTGGQTGAMHRRELDEEQQPHCSIEAGKTRECTTCLCGKSGIMTELIEPSGTVPENASAIMLEAITGKLNIASGIAVCGTLPRGLDPELYRNIAITARDHNLPMLLDSWQNIETVLTVPGIILKINLDELKAITGEKKPETAIKKCLYRYPLRTVAITDGSGHAFLAEKNFLAEFILPKLDHVINPLGAGDTAAAIFFGEFLRGRPVIEAFAAGLAAASASCLTAICAEFNPAVADSIREKIQISVNNY